MATERITSLVVSRKVGQSVRIGESTITISSINGAQVRLQIHAPESTPILRDDAKKKTGGRINE